MRTNGTRAPTPRTSCWRHSEGHSSHIPTEGNGHGSDCRGSRSPWRRIPGGENTTVGLPQGPENTSLRFHRTIGSAARRAAIALSLVVGSALLASSGAIHLQLWAMGYRTIPTIGPLFLFQGSGCTSALVLLLWRRLLVVVAGGGFMVATIGGLLMTVKFGLFGFMDTLAARDAGLSLVLESAGAAVLALVCVALVRGRDRERRAN